MLRIRKIRTLLCTLYVTGWSHWSDWDKCSKHCGGGLTARYRKCMHGPGCKGDDIEKKHCNNHPCPCKFDS